MASTLVTLFGRRTSGPLAVDARSLRKEGNGSVRPPFALGQRGTTTEPYNPPPPQVSSRRQEITDRLNAWTLFNDKNKELCDWLTGMEGKVLHHDGEVGIQEMVEKLKKVSRLDHLWPPQRREGAAGQLQSRGPTWKTIWRNICFGSKVLLVSTRAN